jgi:hypothetical protein
MKTAIIAWIEHTESRCEIANDSGQREGEDKRGGDGEEKNFYVSLQGKTGRSYGRGPDLRVVLVGYYARFAKVGLGRRKGHCKIEVSFETSLV